MNNINYGMHEVKMIDRDNITISGINKILSFDDEEFLMESNMGNISLIGSNLELLQLDTNEGKVKIKGKINSLSYIDGKSKKSDESFFTKLFK